MDDSDNDFNAHYPGHPQNPNKYGLHPPPHGHNPGLSSYSDDDLISDSYPPAPGPVRGVVGKRSPAQLPMGSRVAEAPLSSSGSLFGDAKAQPAAGLHFGDSSSSNADSDSDEEDIFDFNAMKKKTAKLEEKGREKELKELREKELKEQREKEEREKELKEQRERQEREKRDREQEQREKEEREMRDRQRKEIAEREKKDNKDKSREKERSKAISGFSGDLPSGFGDAKGGAFSESGKNDFSNFLRDNSMGGAGDLSGLEGFGKDLSQNKKRQSSIQSVADDESNEFDKQIDFDNGDSASENKGNFLLAGIDSEKVSRAKEESKNKIPSHQDSFEEDSSNDFLDPNSNKAPPESNIRHSNYSFQPGSNSPDIHRMIQGTYPLEHPAAREYVTEALLAEEKMKARDILNNQNIANDKLGVLLKKYNEISIENTRLQTQLQLRNSKDKGYLEENTELKQRLEKYRIENDALIETIDIKELKIQEILSTNRALEQESAQKSRLLKERQEFTSKSYFNTALDSQKRCFEAEIESRDLKIEMLEDALKSAEEKIMIFDAGSELNGTQNLRGAKLTNTDLNSKLVDLQAQLEKRDRLREVESPHDELEKELILGELLLKGVTKENEKLNLENKDLRAKFGFGGTHLTGQLGNTRNHLGAVSNDKDREYKESIIRLQEELQKKHEIIEAGIANLSLKEDIILEKNTSIENLHAQLSQAEEKNKSLITELNRIAFHKSRSPEDSRMIEDLKEKLNILDTQLNQIETENKDYKSHISSYGKESQAAKKEIKSLKKKNSDLQIKVKELETELKQQKDKYSQIRPVKKGPSSKKSKVSETLLGPNNKHIVADFKLNTITIDELDDSLDENFKRVGDLNPSSSQPANNENSSFNDKKQLVKTILHRMKSSDEYQRINDLFDNILVFATKGMLQEMKMPLYDLKSIIEEHPRLSDNYQLINYIDGIFNTLRVDKQGSDGVILDYLRKAENVRMPFKL